MTAQCPDHFKYKKRTYDLYEYPLERESLGVEDQALVKNELDNMKGRYSSCMSGYVATWALIGGKLF